MIRRLWNAVCRKWQAYLNAPSKEWSGSLPTLPRNGWTPPRPMPPVSEAHKRGWQREDS